MWLIEAKMREVVKIWDSYLIDKIMPRPRSVFYVEKYEVISTTILNIRSTLIKILTTNYILYWGLNWV